MADCAPCSKHKQKRNISQKNIFYCTKSYLPTLKNLDKYIAINNVYASKICFHFRRRVCSGLVSGCAAIFCFFFVFILYECLLFPSVYKTWQLTSGCVTHVKRFLVYLAVVFCAFFL